MIVLDTNVISEVMKSSPDGRVLEWLRARPLESLAITAISIAEIRYGLRRLPGGRRREDLEARFRTFLDRGFGDRILSFDGVAADTYGEIAAVRQGTGRPIDRFDAMIAAIAHSRASAVATRNVGDFQGCGIRVLDPWSESA